MLFAFTTNKNEEEKKFHLAAFIVENLYAIKDVKESE
jgi:hypothetical protein